MNTVNHRVKHLLKPQNSVGINGADSQLVQIGYGGCYTAQRHTIRYYIFQNNKGTM